MSKPKPAPWKAVKRWLLPWQPIDTAPRDGSRFVGWGKVGFCTPPSYGKRVTWYGKTSHVPLYGWCHGRNIEDIDLWEPTRWLPITLPASGGAVSGGKKGK